MSSATERSLERRIKRRILGAPQTALIRFPRGFGDICRAETETALAALRLKAAMQPSVTLGANAVEVGGAGFVDLLALALKLATAREILWRVHEAKVASVKALMTALAAVEWDLFFAPRTAVGVRVESTASRLFHEGKVRAAVGDALAAARLTGQGAQGAAHLLDVRLFHDRLTLALSLGGRPLYQRRYKADLSAVASVKEDVAAAATLSALAFIRARHGAAWRCGLALNPFAGSGTLGFEALLALGDIPPTLAFGPLSAESFPCCPTASVRHARKKLQEAWRQRTAAAPLPPLRLVDNDASACRSLQANAAHFEQLLRAEGGGSGGITVVQGDAYDALAALARRPAEGPPFVALNPPYGHRLKTGAASAANAARLGKLVRRGLAAAAGGGYAMLPDPEAAHAFAAAFGAGESATRAFLHGGKTIQLVVFCPAT